MAWAKLDSVSSSSSGNTVSSGIFTAKKFIQIIIHEMGGGSASNVDIRLGNNTLDSSNNYSARRNINGASDVTFINQPNIFQSFNYTNSDYNFGVGYFINISTEEKLAIMNFVSDSATTGAGTAPVRTELVGKWINTTNQFNIDALVNTGTGNMSSDTNISTLGTD